jgi:pyruvate dehydrogenase E2 component (dihydrolipoamide acetyltransferase)
MADDMHVVTMPKLGESVTEGTISQWLKAVGDTVAFDDPLYEVSTDKVDSEVPSPFDGVLLEVLVGEGDTVPVGTELARIGPAGAAPAGAPVAAPAQAAVTAVAAPAPAAPAAEPAATAGAGAHVLTMPKLGESVTEGTISRWLKAVGDTVAFDDPLYEVSTDKVDSEVPSPFDGVLLEILVAAGETVEVGAELARIGAEGRGPATPAEGTRPAAAEGTRSPALAGPPAAPANGQQSILLSPVVRRLAAEHGIDLGGVTGSGANGRIMREDIEAMIAKASPASGLAATAAPAAARTVTAPPNSAEPTAPGVTRALGPRDQAEPLSRLRLTIAARMTESLRISPHVWTSIEVDLEAVERVRQRHKERFRRAEGISLTYLGFIARATCDALRTFPELNSSVDMATKQRILHHYVNLAIAVDLSGQGLVAPVVRDADTLNLRGLARAIRVAADKATSRKLRPDDLEGSTFTITNPGALGDYTAAPIINQPNVAILAAPMVSRRPTVVGDAIAIHHMTILGLSYDHRAFDGVLASRFLAYIRDALQDRDWEGELA